MSRATKRSRARLNGSRSTSAPRSRNGRRSSRLPASRGRSEMKITAVRAHALSAPLVEALWTAQEALKDSSIILVEVETDEGLTGYGEIKGAPMKAIVEWVTRFGEVIKGADPLGHEII